MEQVTVVTSLFFDEGRGHANRQETRRADGSSSARHVEVDDKCSVSGDFSISKRQ